MPQTCISNNAGNIHAVLVSANFNMLFCSFILDSIRILLAFPGQLREGANCFFDILCGKELGLLKIMKLRFRVPNTTRCSAYKIFLRKKIKFRFKYSLYL